jgi:hypothetical protein
MPKVKYIAKTHKTDSITGVGLHWHPGQVRDVTSTVAAHLLPFTDTWEHVEGESEGTEPIDLQEKEKPVEEPLPVMDFHSMTKEQIVKYVLDNFNQKLDKRQTSAQLKERAIHLYTQHAMDERVA